MDIFQHLLISPSSYFSSSRRNGRFQDISIIDFKVILIMGRVEHIFNLIL